MPSISMKRPDLCEILLDCPRDCGNEEVAVEREERADVYTPEVSCYVCGRDKPFTETERATLIERARYAIQNYDPSDRELRAAGMLAE